MPNYIALAFLATYEPYIPKSKARLIHTGCFYLTKYTAISGEQHPVLNVLTN